MTCCSQCGTVFDFDPQTEMIHNVFGPVDLVCNDCIHRIRKEVISGEAGKVGPEKTESNGPPKNTRSNPENRYYWGLVIRFIMKRKNWSQDEAHWWVKETFGIETTKTLPKGKFEQLMSDVRIHVLKYWSLNIPQPNDDIEYLGRRYDWEKLYLIYNENLA